MKTVTVRLSDEKAIADAEARAAASGLATADYLRREIRRVIHEVRDLNQLPPVTKRFAGISPPMTDMEFREFRRGYLTRKHE